MAVSDAYCRSTTCWRPTCSRPTPSPPSSPTPRSPSTRARRRSTSTTACCSTCSTARGRRRPGRRRPLRRRAPGGARRRLPAAAPGEAALRRFFAAVSPYGSGRRARGRCGLDAPARPAAGRAASRPRRRAGVAAAAHRRRRRLRLVRPGGQPSHPRPGTADARARAGLVVRPGTGTSSRTRPALRAWCVTESALRPGLPLWVVENGMANRDPTGGPCPRGRHGPAALHARAPGRGGRRRGGRRPGERLLPLVAHGQLRVGHLRAPLRPLRGGPPRPRRRALHGHRCPGRRRRGGVRPGVAGLHAGDHSVLGRPA